MKNDAPFWGGSLFTAGLEPFLRRCGFKAKGELNIESDPPMWVHFASDRQKEKGWGILNQTVNEPAMRLVYEPCRDWMAFPFQPSRAVSECALHAFHLHFEVAVSAGCSIVGAQLGNHTQTIQILAAIVSDCEDKPSNWGLEDLTRWWCSATLAASTPRQDVVNWAFPCCVQQHRHRLSQHSVR